MFCTNCGATLEEGSKFCTNCGATLGDEAAPAGTLHGGSMPGANPAPGGTTPLIAASNQTTQPPNAGYSQMPMPATMPMNGQPPMGNQPQKKSTVIPIVIAILIVVIVALGAAIGVMWFTNTGVFGNSGTSAVSTSKPAASSSSSSSSSYSTSASTNSSTYELTAYTTGGRQLSGTVRRDANDYVIADSSSRQYTLSELRALNLTPAEICIAWNEPFARLGFHFSNSDLQRYFNSCSWYTDKGIKPNLSGVASKNNELLRELAKEVGDATLWTDLVAY